jgi:hypothetical protein
MENKQNYWLQIIEGVVVGYHDTEPNLENIDSTGWLFIKIETGLPHIYIGAIEADIEDEDKLLENYNSNLEPKEEDVLLRTLNNIHSTMLFKERMGEDISELQTEFENTKVQYYNIIN